jgi:hypothetical protein
MKIYFAKHKNGSVTYCNWPIKETDAESFAFECTEQDLKDVHDGTKDWKIEGGKLEIVTSTRKADMEAAKAAQDAEREQKKTERKNLKKKLEKGEASLAEIQEALHKLL